MADPKPNSSKTSGTQQNIPSQKDSLSAPVNRIREPWENQPCPLCRANKSAKRCDGHGGGGGGPAREGADKKTDKDETKAPFNTLFNFAVVINNDGEAGLTFKLQSSPYHLLSQAQKNELKIIDIVLKELEEFKKENDILTDCKTITRDAKGEILSLSVILPTDSLNTAFIQRLANKNLLQNQNIIKVQNQEGKNTFNPTPLSTKFIPSLRLNEEGKKAEQQNASEEHKKSSSIRPKGPRDKLKPKGWQ